MRTNTQFISKRQNLFFAITFILMALLSTSCSKHIYVSYQPETANTSSIVLKPSKQTGKTNVTINDNLIVDRKNVKDITIKNVPIGTHTVNYTSESSVYKEKMNIQIDIQSKGDGKTITKLVEVPPYSTGYWIYMSASVLISVLLIGAISF